MTVPDAQGPVGRRLLAHVVVPAAIGTATGAGVAAASWLVEGQALRGLAALPGAWPALPSLVALAITAVVVRRVTRVLRPPTAEVYIHVVHDPRGRIVLRELPGRVLAAVATVAGGGSQGLESPSALFGASLVAAAWLEGGAHAAWVIAAALLIRTAGTLACVFGGGGGGVFTSLAVTGVFLGQLVATGLGRTESTFLPLLGGACFLGSGYRIPLASMLLVAESTGDLVLTVVAFVAVGLGQVLMADASVSDAQVDVRAGSG